MTCSKRTRLALLKARLSKPEYRGLRVLLAVLALPTLYMLSSALVFDYSSGAAAMFEESYEGRSVFIGPKPRVLFCPGDYGPVFGSMYSGREWPFRFYAPICKLWRHLEGYAAPKEIRGTAWE